MNIYIHTRSVYGQTAIYVSDAAQAKHVSALTGKKTLSLTHIKALQSLGHEFSLQSVAVPENSPEFLCEFLKTLV